MLLLLLILQLISASDLAHYQTDQCLHLRLLKHSCDSQVAALLVLCYFQTHNRPASDCLMKQCGSLDQLTDEEWIIYTMFQNHASTLCHYHRYLAQVNQIYSQINLIQNQANYSLESFKEISNQIGLLIDNYQQIGAMSEAVISSELQSKRFHEDRLAFLQRLINDLQGTLNGKDNANATDFTHLVEQSMVELTSWQLDFFEKLNYQEKLTFYFSMLINLLILTRHKVLHGSRHSIFTFFAFVVLLVESLKITLSAIISIIAQQIYLLACVAKYKETSLLEKTTDLQKRLCQNQERLLKRLLANYKKSE